MKITKVESIVTLSSGLEIRFSDPGGPSYRLEIIRNEERPLVYDVSPDEMIEIYEAIDEVAHVK